MLSVMRMSVHLPAWHLSAVTAAANGQVEACLIPDQAAQCWTCTAGAMQTGRSACTSRP